MGCNNNNKIKHRCGTKTPAPCVTYDLETPEWSKLEECVTIEETTQELYEEVTRLKSETEVSTISECIEVERINGKVKVNEAIEAISRKVCELASVTKESTSGYDINQLNTKCLVGECNPQPSNLTQVLQALIDEVCKLKGENGGGQVIPPSSPEFVFKADTTNITMGGGGGQQSVSVESTKNGNPHPWDVEQSPEWITVSTTQNSLILTVQSN